MAASSVSDMPLGLEALPEDLRPPTSRLHRVEFIEIDDSDEENAAHSEVEEEAIDLASDDTNGGDYDLVNDGDSISETSMIGSTASASSRPSRMDQSGVPDDLADVINPLRNTADRVSSQIELFARAVSHFKNSPKPDRGTALEIAIALVSKLRKSTESMIAHSTDQDKLRKARSLVKETRGTRGKTEATTDEKVIRLKLEAETWDLLSQLLEIDNIDLSQEAVQSIQREPFQNLHRYSSDYEIWRRFLDVDHFAASTVVIMRWLEKAARGLVHGAIDTTIAELQKKTGRGSGLWTQGWLSSKEKIKGAKRLKGTPGLLEPGDPAMKLRLLVPGKPVPTITHLDPDAPSRQRCPLEKSDQCFEQATWLTLWKMLRQGRSWPEIQTWASERMEQWRAVSLCGSSIGTHQGSLDPFDDSFTRMMSCDSLDVWRLACHALSNNTASEFERAVYALLCGEVEPAYAACQGWSDHLYVYLNSILISRYRDFYLQFQRFIAAPIGVSFTFSLKGPCYKEMHKFLELLKRNERTKAEAKNPYRTIQSAIISRSYADFFIRQSNALSKVASSSKKSTLVPDSFEHDVDEANLITAKDENAIRIVAHLFIFTRGVGQVSSDEKVLEKASVNVIAYINYLQKMDKLDHVPLYASLLRRLTSHSVLGRVLIDVTDDRERLAQVRAMKLQGIDVLGVLESQWKYLLNEAIAHDDLTPIQIKRTVVRPRDGLSPKIISTNKNFACKKVSRESEGLVQSLAWNRYVKGTWNRVCILGTFLYKRFLTAGRLSDARLLYARAPLAQLSLDILGYDVTTHPDLLNAEEGENDGGDGGATPTQESPQSESTQKMGQREKFYAQSQTMRDLELLVDAFEALHKWGELVKQLERSTIDAEIKELTRLVRPTINDITSKVNPLLANDWLDNPHDRPEKIELAFIRTTYLSEVVLQYHHALYTAGQAFTPEALNECLSLSTIISGTPSVIEAFAAAGRMSELADALAISSLALLEYSSKESGQRKRLPHGGTIDIWRATKKQRVEAEA
ncbi:Nucleoporin nup84 [Ascosphaera aggregata]|nr:Nucleoporin nup84 [Ascosphaera aggregata]